MRNNSTRQKVKRTSTSQYQNFEHSGMEKCDQQRLESLEEKTAADTSCRRKGFANFTAKEDRPANASDINLLETIWIIVDVTKYKDPAPKTLDELRP